MLPSSGWLWFTLRLALVLRMYWLFLIRHRSDCRNDNDARTASTRHAVNQEKLAVTVSGSRRMTIERDHGVLLLKTSGCYSPPCIIGREVTTPWSTFLYPEVRLMSWVLNSGLCLLSETAARTYRYPPVQIPRESLRILEYVPTGTTKSIVI